MRCIICGPYLTEEMEMLLPEASPAAGKFLRNMEKGLQAIGIEVVVESFQSIPIPDQVKEALYKLVKADEREYVFKDGKIVHAIYDYRKKILSAIRPGDYVFFYNAVYPTIFMESIIRKKRAHPVLIMADYSEPQEYKSIPKKIISYLAKYDMRRYEQYVVLSSEFMKVIPESKKKMLLQGGIDDEVFGMFGMPDSDNEVFRFYYSGYLSEENGVRMLLDAFKDIDDTSTELMISGKGPLESYVKKCAETDSRIKYYGYVSNEHYYNLLNRAHCVVNPRDMNISQNQNNFPSKIMEYLASGRIIMSTKFAGWDNFKKVIFFVDSNLQTIKNGLLQLNHTPLKKRIDVHSRNIKVAQTYSWNKQVKDMVHFIIGEK